MGLLNSGYSPHEVLAKMFAESAYALGTRCNYYPIANKDLRPIRDVEGDPIAEYESPRVVDVLFETQLTKMRGKKSSTEHDEASQTVSIPKIDVSGEPLILVKNSLLEIMTEDENSDNPIRYEISDIKANAFNSAYWECIICPARVQYDIDPDTPGVQDKKEGNPLVAPVYLNYKR